jgi:hypothetical protein
VATDARGKRANAHLRAISYRAVFWHKDGLLGKVRLTNEEHASLPNKELLARGREETKRLELKGGQLTLEEWVEGIELADMRKGQLRKKKSPKRG